MRIALLAITLPFVLLAGCEFKVGKDKTSGGEASVQLGEDADANVSIAAAGSGDGVSVSVPGFKAKIDIPGIELGSGDMDIDGLKLYPGTKLAGINVTDQKGANNGVVDMRFTSSAAPDKIAAYYAQAARDKNFADVKLTNDAGKAMMTARTRDGDRLMISTQAAPGGSAGRILIRDKTE